MISRQGTLSFYHTCYGLTMAILVSSKGEIAEGIVSEQEFH
jgi:hypothetical protein